MKRPIFHLTNVHSSDNYRVYDREIQTLVKAGYKVNYIVPGAKGETKGAVQFIGVKKYSNEWKRALFTGSKIFKKVLTFPRNSIIHFHSPELFPYGHFILNC